MINWGNIYSLNIQQIDEDHQLFFTTVEEAAELLETPDRDIYKSILDIIQRIQLFSKNHFESEELLMETMHYPDLFEHKMAHSLFLAQITNIDLSLIKDNEETYLLRTLDFLVEWFILHMADFDQQFAKYYHSINV